MSDNRVTGNTGLTLNSNGVSFGLTPGVRPPEAGLRTSRDTKQVLVVRKDLNMRKGKIAAQSAHASMKVLLDLMSHSSTLPYPNQVLYIEPESALQFWLEGSFAKICVSVNSEAELDEVYQKAQKAGIISSMIVDSGRTEFHGQLTKTVVAIGPAWNDLIDPITGHLPLL